MENRRRKTIFINMGSYEDENFDVGMDAIKKHLEENPDNRVQYFRRRTGTSVYVKLSTRSEFDDIKAGNMKEIKNFPQPVENCKLEEIKKEFNKWE
ncbi:hypothetical protein IKQ26_05615 [bacterium]|nr:hypothetical protein [bacterium]